MPGTRFISFKVPLKKSFDFKIAPCQRFSPLDLLREVQNQNEELGLIVDLTCTARYYGPGELPRTLHYAKIFTAGHEIPSDETIYQFKCIVRQFLRENSDNDKLIGVHCTHGLNRTGYLVCRYLIDVQGMVPREAIEMFNRSRGHCMERKNYIDDLTHGPMRNNTGSDKPRLPLAKHQQHVPNVHDALAPVCSPPPHEEQPWNPSHISADAPNRPFSRHPHPGPYVHNRPAPRYSYPPSEDQHRHSRGNNRHRYHHRSSYPHHNGETSQQQGNSDPVQGSTRHWPGYKRHPTAGGRGKPPA
ncbi:hypothetical protein FKM82_023522 [Ascaphus truei]